jgi:hypothetical protein
MCATLRSTGADPARFAAPPRFGAGALSILLRLERTSANFCLPAKIAPSSKGSVISFRRPE